MGGIHGLQGKHSCMALPASQDQRLAFLQTYSLPLSQSMTLSVPQFPLLQDCSEIAIVRLFPFVYSECQQNSSKLSFFFSFVLQP